VLVLLMLVLLVQEASKAPAPLNPDPQQGLATNCVLTPCCAGPTAHAAPSVQTALLVFLHLTASCKGYLLVGKHPKAGTLALLLLLLKWRSPWGILQRGGP
jgi:hypothetical protein